MAGLIAASLLVAGCSQSVGGDGERIQPVPSTSAAATPSRPSTTPPTSTKTAQAPQPGAPIGDVIAWIESASPADAGDYHWAARDGTTTQLGEDVAFTTQSGTSNCMTDSRTAGSALACLVDLAAPPPRPADAYGEWKGGWVDFEGPTLEVGSAHGDPGRFTNGTGQELPYGQALAFGDFRCRADPAGLFCANYAHQSAARLSDAGIEPFGCLQTVTPPADVGLKFSC
jgi:hypothetical protein